MEAYQITSPFHPTLATTLDLIKTLRSLDPSNPDPAISKLAKAVYPEIGDGVWKTVAVDFDVRVEANPAVDQRHDLDRRSAAGGDKRHLVSDESQ